MNWAWIPNGLIVVGVFLLALAFYWTSWLGPLPNWTEEQAQEHARTSAEYHRRVGATLDRKKPSEGDKQALEHVATRYEIQRRAIERARSRHQWFANLIKWSGITSILVGIGWYVIGRNREHY